MSGILSLLYSPLFAWGGLLACLFLAFWVDWQIWLTGLGLIALGLIWHLLRRRFSGVRTGENVEA